MWLDFAKELKSNIWRKYSKNWKIENTSLICKNLLNWINIQVVIDKVGKMKLSLFNTIKQIIIKKAKVKQNICKFFNYLFICFIKLFGAK